jgi:hypothetical protein
LGRGNVLLIEFTVLREIARKDKVDLFRVF